MATVINNPSTRDTSDSGLGIIFGIILVVALAVILFVYGVPALQGTNNNGGTINVPDKINVDLNNSPR